MNGGAVVSQFDFPAVLPLQIGEGKQIVPLGIGVVLPLDIAVCHLKLNFPAVPAGDGGKGHQVAPFGIGLARIAPLDIGAVGAKLHLPAIGAAAGYHRQLCRVAVNSVAITIFCYTTVPDISRSVVGSQSTDDIIRIVTPCA